MNKKVINPMNLVGYVANAKANKFIADMNLAGVTVNTGIQLNKVILRKQTLNAPAGKPFYAFAKSAGEQTILIDLVSGKPVAVNNSAITSMTQVTGKFVIDGVIYGKKDTLHNYPRYTVCSTLRQPRSKAMNRRKTMAEFSDR